MEDELAMRSRAMPRAMRGGRKGSKKKGKGGERPVEAPVNLGPPRVTLSETITVGELADQLRVGAAEVVKDLMRMGVLASITQVGEGRRAHSTHSTALSPTQSDRFLLLSLSSHKPHSPLTPTPPRRLRAATTRSSSAVRVVRRRAARRRAASA